MKFTPLVYILIATIVMPPPHVFAEPAPKIKTYAERLGDVVKEAAEREKELASLTRVGPSCAPSAWVNNCNGTTPGNEIKNIGNAFKNIRESLQKLLPEAQKLDSQISADKLSATTACKGGTGSLAQYQEESKAAAEKIRPVLASAVSKVQELRKKYNTYSNKFLPMVRQCGGAKMLFAGDSQLPQFAGEGMVMLYKPVMGTSASCDPPSADAAKFFVDPKLRRSADQGVQRIYGMAGQAASGLQDFEAVAKVTLENLEGKIADLAKASKQNKEKNNTDCGPVQPGTALASGAPSDAGKKAGSDISGNKPPAEGSVGGASPAGAAKNAPSEAEAAAKAAAGEGKLDQPKDKLAKIDPSRASPSSTGTGAAQDIFADNSVEDKDVTWDPKSEKNVAAPLEKSQVGSGAAGGDSPSEQSANPAVSTEEKSAPRQIPLPTRETEMADQEKQRLANEEVARKNSEAVRNETAANNAQQAAEQAKIEAEARAKAAEDRAAAIVGIAALGAIGGGIYMATKGKKKSSDGGAFLPPAAPAPTATATATETSVSTATETSTSTSTGTSTATRTNTGVVIDLGPGSGNGPSSATQTITATSTSTATNGSGAGDVNRAKVNATGATIYRAPAPKKKLNTTGASVFRPAARP